LVQLGKTLQKTDSFFISLLSYIKIRLTNKPLDSVAFLGPDGGGKGGLMNSLLAKRPDKFIGINMGLRAKKSILADGPNRLMHRFIGFTKNILKSSDSAFVHNLVQPLFHLALYVELLLRLIRSIPLTKNGHLLIDRYFGIEAFTDPKRKAGNFLGKAAIRLFFPMPSFAFLLLGDSHKIHQRKPDMHPEEIDSYIAETRMFLETRNIAFHQIDTVKYRTEANVKIILRVIDNSL
jgi:hypothetical protein